MPVVMVNPLDWVVSVILGTTDASVVEAVTLTGVLTVPELTVITTSPLASDTRVAGAAGVSVMPPTLVLRLRVTLCPLSGFPVASNTLKLTSDVSVPPIPFREMLAGVAETNWIEPVVGGVTTKLAGADVTPAAVAVIASVVAQPLSLYEPLATPPAPVTTPVLNTALSRMAQVEENVTLCGAVTGTPPTDTVTSILVVPKAESVVTPRTGAVTVTTAVPTVNPIESVTAVRPTCAVTLTVAVPAVEAVVGVSLTVATPKASVTAVAPGAMVTRVGSVLKVRTVFAIAMPLPYFKVALSVAGALLKMEVTGSPAELASASAKSGVEVLTVAPVVPVVPVVVALLVSFGTLDPLPQPARTASVAARKSNAARREISWPRQF